MSTLFALALALLGPVSVAAPASAHATMAASWPADEQVLTVAPDHILVEFTTAVSPDSLVAIVDPAGSSVTVGDPTVEGRFLNQRIKPAGAEPDRTPSRPAPAAAGSVGAGHDRALMPGIQIVVLAAMAAMVLRRSRTHPV